MVRGDTAEEHCSNLSTIWMCKLPLLQQNPPVVNSGCWLKQADLHVLFNIYSTQKNQNHGMAS